MNTADLLSEVFAALRLRSELTFLAELRGDFAIALPRARRQIRFHLVRQGGCWIARPGEDPIALGAGDLVMVPHGGTQVLSSAPGLDPVPLETVLARHPPRDGKLALGEGADPTRLLCGSCHFDEAVDHPVLTGLPGLLTVRPVELEEDPGAAAALRLLALESDLEAQGGNGILTRLIEIVFLQAARRLATAQEGESGSFLGALADGQIFRALAAIHREPEKPWQTGELALAAEMSRARFSVRFSHLVGLPPIGYLTAWRLLKARTLLTDTALDLAEIAEHCGYPSVPAFTRRFKSAFGIGPGSYRRGVPEG